MTAVPEPSPWQAGRRAVREIAAPASAVLLASALFVAAYYRFPEVRASLEHVAAVRREHGYLFAAGLTAVTAGLIPWCFRMALSGLRPARPALDLLHSLVWWAILGLTVDQLYRILTTVFGDTPTPGVVLSKVACDMLIFTPFIASPGNALSHLWKDSGWDFARIRAQLTPGWYRRLVVPNLIPNYFVWLPGTAIFYCMPADLQLVVANCIGCCWGLLCARIAAHTGKSEPLA